MTELRPGDIVRLDGPPYHSSRTCVIGSRQPKPGEMGVVISSQVRRTRGIVEVLTWAWVDFPLLGEYCMFPDMLTVVGHVE